MKLDSVNNPLTFNYLFPKAQPSFLNPWINPQWSLHTITNFLSHDYHSLSSIDRNKLHVPESRKKIGAYQKNSILRIMRIHPLSPKWWWGASFPYEFETCSLTEISHPCSNPSSILGLQSFSHDQEAISSKRKLAQVLSSSFTTDTGKLKHCIQYWIVSYINDFISSILPAKVRVWSSSSQSCFCTWFKFSKSEIGRQF